MAATAAGHAAFRAAARTAAAEVSWRQARAVLLASAPSALGNRYGAPVRARWAAPGGVRRIGAVSVPWGTKAGMTVLVWVDAAGRLTGLPMRLSQVRGQAVLATVLAPIVRARWI